MMRAVELRIFSTSLTFIESALVLIQQRTHILIYGVERVRDLCF